MALKVQENLNSPGIAYLSNNSMLRIAVFHG